MTPWLFWLAAGVVVVGLVAYYLVSQKKIGRIKTEPEVSSSPEMPEQETEE